MRYIFAISIVLAVTVSGCFANSFLGRQLTDFEYYTFCHRYSSREITKDELGAELDTVYCAYDEHQENFVNVLLEKGITIAHARDDVAFMMDLFPSNIDLELGLAWLLYALFLDQFAMNGALRKEADRVLQGFFPGAYSRNIARGIGVFGLGSGALVLVNRLKWEIKFNKVKKMEAILEQVQ
jgi:hypothetical protein